MFRGVWKRDFCQMVLPLAQSHLAVHDGEQVKVLLILCLLWAPTQSVQGENN